jgi:hypothetical protein
MENKQLPAGLKDNPQVIKDAVKQWSQLVAWSWTDFLAFQEKNPQDRARAAQEQRLKEFFIKIHQDQARYLYAISSYEEEEQKPNAYAASITIKKLLMGRNDEIDELEGVRLTLSEVYEKLTNQLPEVFCDETFMQMFHLQIITDRFSGYVRDILDSEKNEIREGIKKISAKDLKYVEDVQYISYLAYPPCPVFCKTTVTENRLTQWIQNKNERGEPTADYLPPSAFLPISLS